MKKYGASLKISKTEFDDRYNLIGNDIDTLILDELGFGLMNEIKPNLEVIKTDDISYMSYDVRIFVMNDSELKDKLNALFGMLDYGTYSMVKDILLDEKGRFNYDTKKIGDSR